MTVLHKAKELAAVAVSYNKNPICKRRDGQLARNM
jgi:hypothetical protein